MADTFLDLLKRLIRPPKYNPQSFQTALMLAVASHDLKSVEVLIARGADVNARGTSGNTALHFASRSSSPTILAKLLDKGADKEAKNDAGHNPLIEAICEGNVGTAEPGRTMLAVAVRQTMGAEDDCFLIEARQQVFG